MADAAAALPADPAVALKRAQQGKSYWQRVWERLRDDKVTLVVIGVLVVLLTMVVFAPWFTVHDPYTGSALRRLKPIGTPGHSGRKAQSSQNTAVSICATASGSPIIERAEVYGG